MVLESPPVPEVTGSSFTPCKEGSPIFPLPCKGLHLNLKKKTNQCNVNILLIEDVMIKDGEFVFYYTHICISSENIYGELKAN